jgi:hypothetical protein
MFKLPFSWMPGSWGLKGTTRDIAHAEYELSGYELEKRILEIKTEDHSSKDYIQKCLEIDRRYDKISQEEYDQGLANLIEDETLKSLALTELEFRANKLTDTEYAKKIATLKGEPWVNVVNMDFTKKSSLEGSFELDWNGSFVEKLKSEGYTGPSDDIIVNQWFMELCRNIAMEEFDGTGNFAADSEANLDAVKRWSTESLPKGRKGHS